MVLGESRYWRINRTYVIHEKIANGLYGGVYRVTDRRSREFAAKIVPSKNRIYLENESKAMPTAQDPSQQAPFCYYYGSHGDNHVLVMDLLGESLLALEKQFLHLNIKSVLFLGTQMINCVETLHNRGYIHRDIIPENFLIGNHGEDRKKVHLIDYALAARLLDTNGQHLPVTMGSIFIGLPDFASRQALKNEPESRRSDLESVVYVIIYLLKGLPWEHVPDTDVDRIFNMKERITGSELCYGLPREIEYLYNEVKCLGYEECPDYERLRSHLLATLRRYRFDTTVGFEWVACI